MIVGSILLAFAIDAAWEDRQQQALTNRRVRALISEFEQTRSELRADSRSTARSYEGTMSVLGLMREPPPDLTVLDLRDQLTRSFNVGVFTAEHPVLTMMLQSGELLEAESDSLMALVTAWQEDIAHLEMDSQHLDRTRDEVITGRAIELGIPLTLEPPGERLLRILEDASLEAAFAQRAGRARRLSEFYENVAASADSIIHLLEQSWPNAR